MPEKDPNNWSLAALWPWLSTLALGTFATAAQYAAKIRGGEPFSWPAVIADWIICVFAAVVTHMLCEVQGVDGLARSVLVALSAHSGTRVVMRYERWRDRLMGIDK